MKTTSETTMGVDLQWFWKLRDWLYLVLRLRVAIQTRGMTWGYQNRLILKFSVYGLWPNPNVKYRPRRFHYMSVPLCWDKKKKIVAAKGCNTPFIRETIRQLVQFASEAFRSENPNSRIRVIGTHFRPTAHAYTRHRVSAQFLFSGFFSTACVTHPLDLACKKMIGFR